MSATDAPLKSHVWAWVCTVQRVVCEGRSVALEEEVVWRGSGMPQGFRDLISARVKRETLFGTMVLTAGTGTSMHAARVKRNAIVRRERDTRVARAR